jgi:alpha-L-fucosidase
VQGFEQDLPGENTARFNTTQIHDLPLEICMTINDNWGIHFEDENHKSTRKLLHNLVKSASLGGNYLLNVGPTAEGEILPVQAGRLREMGVWLDSFGVSLYGTRAGLIPSTRETVSTYQPGSDHSSGKHYLHILEYISDYVKLTSVPNTIKYATLLKDGSLVQMNRHDDFMILSIPVEKRDTINTVILLE